jgi:hypothetical protein
LTLAVNPANWGESEVKEMRSIIDRIFVAIFIVFLGLWLYGSRYTIVGSGQGAAYRLDKMTGDVTFMMASDSMRVNINE